ncbi:SDR family oxidoreductase [Flexibacterium corallicola]|uniref:SDR family oxidoreductase n=1 Tax=Flexibacterium corallicola TaxID=3037259 RepID=UPI00286ECAFF|nr:SDR family oxidoreductase [Pseudovibrio sp. M1P-2-3]
MSKVILITGTSTGLGVELAVQAAKAGHKVYASMRNLHKREVLDEMARQAGAALEVVQLDVTDTASVNAAIDHIIEREGRIDTLINNAGAGFVRTLEQATEDEISWVLDVNLRGVMTCTKAVMPFMRKQRSGHVVNIGSVGGLVGQPFNEVYCAAKFAVEGLTESMASYITPKFSIHFTVVEPGGISSEFGANVLRQMEETGGILDDEYGPILLKYIEEAQKRAGEGDVYQTPEQVAEVVIGCVESSNPPVRLRTSKWAEDFTSLKTGLDLDGEKQRARVVEQFLTE